MKILLTAFDAFGGEKVNPSLLAVQGVTAPHGVELIRLEVPTAFFDSIRTVEDAMDRERPDVVLCIGQAGGRNAVTPERVAINVMDAGIPDNKGFQPTDQPIDPEGENALFATVPVKKITAAITAAGVPSVLSNTAGTFVCNQLLYGVLRLCQKKYPHTKAGFLHVPFLPEQVESRPGWPSLPLSQMVKALEAAIRAVSEG